MSNIIPFEGSQLPAYLRNPAIAAQANADLMAHASAGFPALSIKGKTFTLVREGERTMLMNPKDPESAASNIDVVLIKVNPKLSKVYYAKAFVEGEDAKPDCFSNDGSVPDAQSTTPQSKTCATCKHAVWGSKITEQGKKAKACSDSIRMAVATADQLNDPILLRVPAATIKAVGEYGTMLAKRGVPYNAVVTKVSFDKDSASPKLEFKAVGFLAEDAAGEAQSMADTDIVGNILGLANAMAHDEGEAEEAAAAPAAPVAEKPAPVVAKPKAAAVKTKTVTPAEVVAAVAAAVGAPEDEPAEEVAKVPKKVAAASAVEVSLDLADLDNLDFE